MITGIIGTGSFLPGTTITNQDLSGYMDTSDDWIFSRTGIRERKLAKTETTSSMAIEASIRAMENAGVKADEIDLIIVGTITGDYVTPSTACEVQAGIGAVNAIAFDVNAACSGFMYALNIADAYIKTGTHKTALILGVETLSKIMDWNDRSTCVLFGDGAGACIVREKDKGIMGFDMGSDGKKGLVLACKNRDNNNILVENDKTPGYVKMEGQEVYKFAVTNVPESILKVLDRAGVAADEIKYFVLHQANIRILQSVAKRLQVKEDKFPMNLDHCGNISAGSIPILLDEMNQKGMLQPGDKIIMSGFGGGLTWGSVLLEW